MMHAVLGRPLVRVLVLVSACALVLVALVCAPGRAVADVSWPGGNVVVWPASDPGSPVDLTPPAGLTDAVAVAASGSHVLALRHNGTVVAWGSNYFGETSPPPGLDGVVAIAAGSRHSLALRSDGTVVAWGANYFGESTPPADLSDAVAIVAGDSWSLAFRRNGGVVAWGSGASGVPGDDWLPRPSPLGGSGAQIVSGGDYALVIHTDGTLSVIGYDRPVGANLSAFYTYVAVAGDERFVAGVTDSGGVIVSYGGPQPPAGLSDVVDIGVVGGSAVALKRDGTLVGWGQAGYAPPGDLSGVRALSDGGTFVALTGGTPDTEAPHLVLPTAVSAVTHDGRGAFVDYPVELSDDSDPNPRLLCRFMPGAWVPVGTFPAACFARDAAGNRAPISMFPITVSLPPADVTPPTLHVPIGMTVEATGPQGARVVFEVWATDDTDPAPVTSCVPSTGSVFPLGLSVVRCSATDTSGNTATSAFDVRVVHAWSGVLQPVNTDGSSCSSRAAPCPSSSPSPAAAPP